MRKNLKVGLVLTKTLAKFVCICKAVLSRGWNRPDHLSRLPPEQLDHFSKQGVLNAGAMRSVYNRVAHTEREKPARALPMSRR